MKVLLAIAGALLGLMFGYMQLPSIFGRRMSFIDAITASDSIAHFGIYVIFGAVLGLIAGVIFDKINDKKS